MTTALRKHKICREITTGTKEWADHNVNCIKGCYNNCRYCYAKMMAKRFGRTDGDSWVNMTINPEALRKNYHKYEGRVMFPSTHDIINDPAILEACTIVIKKLLDVGNQLLITTKPDPVVVASLINNFEARKEQIQFRFTITSMNNSILSFWEPNAPTFEQRFASLRSSYEAGFKTSVSVEPFLDESPQQLIKQLLPYTTESIWLGPMNYVPHKIIAEGYEREYNYIRQISSVDNLFSIYNDLDGFPLIRFKDSMSNRLGLINDGTMQ